MKGFFQKIRAIAGTGQSEEVEALGVFVLSLEEVDDDDDDEDESLALVLSDDELDEDPLELLPDEPRLSVL